MTLHDVVRVDGNALAGILAPVFAGEVTSIVGWCRECGSTAPLAEAVVELDDLCAIVLCRGCTHTLLTVMRDGDGVRLTFGALERLEVSAAE